MIYCLYHWSTFSSTLKLSFWKVPFCSDWSTEDIFTIPNIWQSFRNNSWISSFLIYINDLPNNLVVNSLLFAHDLKIFATNHSDIILRLERQKIGECCSKWLFCFNPNKCKQISFGSDTALPITLDNAVIAYTTLQKDLGITVDNKINLMIFTHQVN